MSIYSERVIKTQRKKRVYAIQFYGGKCVRCGYDKCIDALEFHHKDRTSKKAKPTYVIRRWRWTRVKEELDKCDLVCSNCHKEIHFEQFFGIGTRAAE